MNQRVAFVTGSGRETALSTAAKHGVIGIARAVAHIAAFLVLPPMAECSVQADAGRRDITALAGLVTGGQ